MQGHQNGLHSMNMELNTLHELPPIVKKDEHSLERQEKGNLLKKKIQMQFVSHCYTVHVYICTDIYVLYMYIYMYRYTVHVMCAIPFPQYLSFTTTL